MNVTKEFAKVSESVKKERSELLPDTFTQAGKAVILGVSKDELGKPDQFGRMTLKVKDQELLVKQARGVDKELEAYDVAVFKANTTINLPNGSTLPEGYPVWRLVAPN